MTGNQTERISKILSRASRLADSFAEELDALLREFSDIRTEAAMQVPQPITTPIARLTIHAADTMPHCWRAEPDLVSYDISRVTCFECQSAYLHAKVAAYRAVVVSDPRD